jgi:hypothetical protein
MQKPVCRRRGVHEESTIVFCAPRSMLSAVSPEGPPALPAGVSVHAHTLTAGLDCDSHGFVYRATEREGGRVVLLREFFPAGLVTRASGGTVVPVGAPEGFRRALADFLVQVSERSCIEHPALWSIEDYWLHGGTAWVKMPWVEDRTPQGGTHDPTGPVGDAWLDQWVLDGCEALEVACRGAEGEETGEDAAPLPVPGVTVVMPVPVEPPPAAGRRRSWWRIWGTASMVALFTLSPAATPVAPVSSPVPAATLSPWRDRLAGVPRVQITGPRGSAASIAIRRGRSWVQLVLVGS